MRRLVIVLVVLAACSTSGRQVAPTEADDVTIPAPTTDLAVEDVPWVAFEANWLCDLQRSTYPDPADVEAALQDRIADQGIDPEEYEAFQQRLDDDTDLALHVQAAVLERCGDSLPNN